MEVRYPPPQKGHLSDTCAIPKESKANGCDTPLCDTAKWTHCSRVATRAACYIQKMAGEGAGKSAAKIRGAGGSAGEGAARGVSLERDEQEHPRQHYLQHAEFSQHSCQHPPQPFSGLPRFSFL